MKATIFSICQSCYLILAFLMLPLSFTMFVSCEKEKIIEEMPSPPLPDEDCNRPHEIEDMVAWFNPIESVLFVDPAYSESVMASLSAQPLNDGLYQLMGVNLMGEPLVLRFKIAPMKIPDIYYTATTVEQKLGPDLVLTFTEKGTSYKVYKNAECGKVEKGFESACENSTDGTSKKRTWFDIQRCGRGNGFCTEALGLIGKSITYHNSNCQGPVKGEDSLYGYSCWQ